MYIKNDLLRLIDEFAKSLGTHKYNQYIPKLRDYFLPFILEKKSSIEDINRLFSNEFTLSDISDATVYYIQNNENVESSAAIKDYLITLNQFFIEIIYKKYHNPSLAMQRSFTNLEDEVNRKLQKLNINLRDPEPFPAITKDDYNLLLPFLEDYGDKTLAKVEVKCILKIFLLYGFSMDKLAEIHKDDFNVKANTLKVNIDNSCVHLELPHSLANNIKEYLSLRSHIDSNLLFINTKGKKITPSFTSGFYEALLNEYSELKATPNRFTNTGVGKYGIINMILKGMNTSIISEFTGQKSDILDDCQRTVNAIQQLKRNRYINHMIRGIETYDEV